MATQLNVGGQALIEGVLMRSPHYIGAAVRLENGSIETRLEKFDSIQKGVLAWPIVRGNAALFEMMLVGTRYLKWSGNLALPPEQREQMPAWKFILTFAVSLAIGMALFIVLPSLVAEWTIGNFTDSTVALNVCEAVVKLVLFVGYVYLIGLRASIRRIFEYHGAEHKAVHAYEHNRPLTPEGARPFDTPHPRCGTAFALLVIFVSVILFALLPWLSAPLRVTMRILLMPVVTGICYEILKCRWKKFSRVAVIPGMWLQRLTTRQPDDSELEVGCAALKLVLDAETQGTVAATASPA
jgi:uncharacterized protein YqhQ